ncbi:restriction endonuclease [Agrobacterium rosae]|uniref:restriction endonuclease n=1 Tax=Agrobacterium rosae TaxID=1972867 RepID=UPI003A812C4D
MDHLTFEELLLEAFERRGHVVQRNASYSGDGGLDGSVVMARREKARKTNEDQHCTVTVPSPSR